jgi:hypothetical protein
MRPGGYIGQFGKDIDAKLAELEETVARRPDHGAHLRPTAAGHGERRPVHEQPLRSDHPGSDRLTHRILGLAFGVAMGLAIPITLFITFGMSHMLGIDLQQVSIATLIIALGLLVDVPVVAGDAIKNQLGVGLPQLMASWVGPTKLIVAIMFATITNIVAYLPFLTLPGARANFYTACPSC